MVSGSPIGSPLRGEPCAPTEPRTLSSRRGRVPVTAPHGRPLRKSPTAPRGCHAVPPRVSCFPLGAAAGCRRLCPSRRACSAPFPWPPGGVPRRRTAAARHYVAAALCRVLAALQRRGREQKSPSAADAALRKGPNSPPSRGSKFAEIRRPIGRYSWSNSASIAEQFYQKIASLSSLAADIHPTDPGVSFRKAPLWGALIATPPRQWWAVKGGDQSARPWRALSLPPGSTLDGPPLLWYRGGQPLIAGRDERAPAKSRNAPHGGGPAF